MSGEASVLRAAIQSARPDLYNETAVTEWMADVGIPARYALNMMRAIEREPLIFCNVNDLEAIYSFLSNWDDISNGMGSR